MIIGAIGQGIGIGEPPEPVPDECLVFTDTMGTDGVALDNVAHTANVITTFGDFTGWTETGNRTMATDPISAGIALRSQYYGNNQQAWFQASPEINTPSRKPIRIEVEVAFTSAAVSGGLTWAICTRRTAGQEPNVNYWGVEIGFRSATPSQLGIRPMLIENDVNISGIPWTENARFGNRSNEWLTLVVEDTVTEIKAYLKDVPGDPVTTESYAVSPTDMAKFATEDYVGLEQGIGGNAVGYGWMRNFNVYLLEPCP